MTTKTATRRKAKRRVVRQRVPSKWIKTEADELAVAAGCRFDESLAEDVRDFFRKYLRHGKGKWAGQPFELLDWQYDNIIGPIFGWIKPNGFRRIRKVYVEVAKKNGKSAIGSGIGIYMFIGDGEEGAEVYSAATKQTQASIVHDEAMRMVRASTPLSTRLRINETTHCIHDAATSSIYKALSADAAGSEGLNAHAIIKDELHVWTKRPFFDSLEYAGAARDQSLDFEITTAGIFNPESIGWQEHEYARRFLAGDFPANQSYHAFICAAEPTDDILDPETHKKANPSYGVTIDPDEIMKAARDAKERPSLLNSCLRYRFNIWTAQMESWLPMDKWKACGGAFDESMLRGRTCYAGLDLASIRDLAALALVFPPQDGDEFWRLILRCFAPRVRAVERERDDGVPYVRWGDDGWLTLTPGESTDYETIRQRIISDSELFDMQGIGADPWQMNYLAKQLEGDGFEIVMYGQNLKNFSAPSKKFESLIVDGLLRHGDNPIGNWSASHVATFEDGLGNIRPCKKTSTDRIDPTVATIMAVGMAMVGDEVASPGIELL